MVQLWGFECVRSARALNRCSRAMADAGGNGGKRCVPPPAGSIGFPRAMADTGRPPSHPGGAGSIGFPGQWRMPDETGMNSLNLTTVYFGSTFWKHILEARFGSTFWKPFWKHVLEAHLEAVLEALFGSTFWKHVLEALFGSTFWKHIWKHNYFGSTFGSTFWKHILGRTYLYY